MTNNLSGTVNDPELLQTYGAELLGRVANILKKCKEHNIKIVTAESLTGGGIANLLTALSGSSNMLDRGYVVYNNQAKIDMLGVSEEDLRIHEAVSKPVAEQMATGALQKSNATISIAVTGYAGAYGDDERGIKGGTVFISSAVKKPLDFKNPHVVVQEHNFTGERTADRKATINAAVDMLEKSLDYYLSRQLTERSGGTEEHDGIPYSIISPLDFDWDKATEVEKKVPTLYIRNKDENRTIRTEMVDGHTEIKEEHIGVGELIAYNIGRIDLAKYNKNWQQLNSEELEKLVISAGVECYPPPKGILDKEPDETIWKADNAIICRPAGYDRKIVEIDRNFCFTNSWGQRQYMREGSVIASFEQDGKRLFYGIDKDALLETYGAIDSKQTFHDAPDTKIFGKITATASNNLERE